MDFFKSFWPRAPKKSEVSLRTDAFSDGQIGSKLWLCRELETVLQRMNSPHEAGFYVRVYAGWYGVLPFLLFAREKILLSRVELFDLDGEAVKISQAINDHWRFTGRYLSATQDVNASLATETSVSNRPDVVINTSCEHFESDEWWKKLPAGTMIAIQGTDMPHTEHVKTFSSLAAFRSAFAPWGEIHYEGQMDFKYATLEFSRFMIIGQKTS